MYREYTAREKVFWFAVSSRALVILLQFVFNNLCPDHDADAFRSPRIPFERANLSIYDKLVEFFFGGLTRWDSQYFIHIAKYGYTYENTLAFFPLFPLSLSSSAYLMRLLSFPLNKHSAIIVSGVIINFLCFIKSALVLFDLSEQVLKRTTLAYKAAILYCINPASIFFTAIYSESLFAYITFSSMLSAVQNYREVWIPISFSTMVRSNGLVNLGFPIFYRLRDIYFLLLPKIININYRKIREIAAFLLDIFRTIPAVLTIFHIVFLSFIPFVLLQIYNWIAFCVEYSEAVKIPEHLAVFANENDLLLPGSENLTWCQDTLPIAYSKVQEKYWNVGLFNYYQWRQIPNFVLAAPILFIMFKCVFQFFLDHKITIKNGIQRRAKNRGYSVNLHRGIFVFVAHGTFLTLFSILIVHIQVSTRLLSSASPIIYWYCASLMSYRNKVVDIETDEDYEEDKHLSSRWRVFFMAQKSYTVNDILVITYFLGYTVFGCFMYSNFLPWT